MTTPKGMTDAAASSRPPPPLALPPPDEHILELERLLSLAKVGTHELTSGESSPAAANHLSAAPSWSNFRHDDSRMDNAAVDAADLTQRLNESINESIGNDDENMNDDEEPHTAEEVEDHTGEGAVLQVEEDEPLPSSASSSSEGSGVLVEAPPPPVEMIGTHSEQKKLLVPFQPHRHSNNNKDNCRSLPTAATTSAPRPVVPCFVAFTATRRKSLSSSMLFSNRVCGIDRIFNPKFMTWRSRLLN
jgi:hypothetical protein